MKTSSPSLRRRALQSEARCGLPTTSPNTHRVQPIERFPAKPRPDGRFQKRIFGTLHYFGKNGDRATALADYERVKHQLYSRQAVTPAEEMDNATVKELANRFLHDRNGELAAITYKQYRSALKRFVRFVGVSTPWSTLTPDHFTRFARRLKSVVGGYAFNRERAAVVAMFHWADEQDWIDHAPKFGKGFRKVPRSELRDRQQETILGRDEINALLGASSRQMFAMILLAVNGGYGPGDLGLLEWPMIDLAKGVIVDKRAKTKIRRFVTLWPETVFALQRCRRPDDPRVFRTRSGKAWTSTEIGHQFAVAADRAGLELQKGVNIYALRHTFATIANELGDPDARKRLMGHSLTGLDDHYVLSIFEPRLRAVTDHVRNRLGIVEIVGEVPAVLQ